MLYTFLQVLFQVSIAMVFLKNKELLAADNSAQIFNILSTLPSTLNDVEILLKVLYEVVLLLSVSFDYENYEHINQRIVVTTILGDGGMCLNKFYY